MNTMFDKKSGVLVLRQKEKPLENQGFHAGDGAHEVRWTSALRRPKRSVDLESWIQVTLCFRKKKGRSIDLPFSFLMQEMGLEPMSPSKNTIKKGVFSASNRLGNILETIYFMKHYACIWHSVFLLSVIYLVRQT